MRQHYVLDARFASSPTAGSSLVFRALAVVSLCAALAAARTAPINAGTQGPAPAIEVPVYSRGSGTIQDVLVADGSAVAKGQVLARLDSADLDHEIETVELRIAMLADELDAGFHAAARGNFAKAADRQQLTLKKTIFESDLRFLKAKRATMEIAAPASGHLVSQAARVVGQRTEPGDVLFHIRPEQPRS